MTMRSRFWFECNPSRGECDAKSPERDTAAAARDAAWEAHWHLELLSYGFSGEAQCPKHIKMLDRMDWGSTN